jgi:hypothetical protein
MPYLLFDWLDTYIVRLQNNVVVLQRGKRVPGDGWTERTDKRGQRCRQSRE